MPFPHYTCSIYLCLDILLLIVLIILQCSLHSKCICDSLCNMFDCWTAFACNYQATSYKPFQYISNGEWNMKRPFQGDSCHICIAHKLICTREWHTKGDEFYPSMIVLCLSTSQSHDVQLLFLVSKCLD